MNAADVLQTASLVTLAITIVLSFVQNRHAAVQARHAGSQTDELVQQSTLAHRALSQTAYQTMLVHGSGLLAALISDEPDLISWFLASRGIPPGSPEANKRYMLLYLRMEVHEATYLAYREKSLSDDLWQGWHRVITLDAATPEFRRVWTVAAETYSATFARFINELIEASPVAPPIEPLPDVSRRTGWTAGRYQSADPRERRSG